LKKIDPEDIPAILGRKAKIGIGNGCAEPQTLVEALISHRIHFDRLSIYGMILFTAQKLFKQNEDGRFRLKSFMIDRVTAQGIDKGYVDYIPCRYSQVPKLFLSGRLPIDVALISLSPCDDRGNCSFGVSSDFTKAMSASAKIVIAELNRQMPLVYGDNFINREEVDYYVESDRPLPQVSPPKLRETDYRIGRHVAGIIDDEATIQIGIGRISEGIFSFIGDKQRLGIHSGLLTDGVVPLIQKGIIDNSRKGSHNGKVVTTTMIGTQNLYRFVHNNRTIESFPSDYVHNQVIIAKLNRLHAINSAIQVDLSGQVNAETINGIQISGVGGQSDFMAGASLSKGGKSIIVTESSYGTENKSKIVPYLEKAAAVTSLRHDVGYVVTEYGIAHLRGKSLRERARALINIAHPQNRDWLESERRRL
jgi:4-hydroxybutyrate CoA-transferase